MELQRPRSLRGFVQTPAGRAVLLAFALAVVFGAFYLNALCAIPAMLIVGLWLPIYLGLKRPRRLAQHHICEEHSAYPNNGGKDMERDE